MERAEWEFPLKIGTCGLLWWGSLESNWRLTAPGVENPLMAKWDWMMRSHNEVLFNGRPSASNSPASYQPKRY